MNRSPTIRLLEETTIGIRLAAGQTVDHPKLVQALLENGTRCTVIDRPASSSPAGRSQPAKR
jgi:hypothetical protein